MKAEYSIGMPGINNSATQCNNPEELNPQLQDCGNLETWKI
jgi:hypothetical protein